MAQCSRCDFQNSIQSPYCEQCGAFLETSPLYNPTSDEMFTYQNQKVFPPRLRMSRFKVLRSILYFVIAVPIAAFGLLAAFFSFGNSPRTGGLGFFFALGLIVGSIVLFYRTRHRIQLLRWPHLIWWFLGATVGMLMAYLLEVAFIPNAPNGLLGSVIFSCIILLYGLILAAVTLW